MATRHLLVFGQEELHVFHGTGFAYIAGNALLTATTLMLPADRNKRQSQSKGGQGDRGFRVTPRWNAKRPMVCFAS
jgi:hypothetical protein